MASSTISWWPSTAPTPTHPLEVYRFLRDEAKATWIQFIPVVERIDEEGHTIYQKGTRISERSVRPEQFGRFLIQIFDEWVRHDVGRVYVQTFEAAVRNWLRMPSSGMCVFEETCGLGLALEHNGDLYSCDHFVEPDYLLGNIMDSHMVEMVTSEKQRQFGRDKRDTLPRYCRECDVLFACHGECPKNRFHDHTGWGTGPEPPMRRLEGVLSPGRRTDADDGHPDAHGPSGLRDHGHHGRKGG